ncbi:hypothetical protein FQN49_002538 [Arthroderma sp. PD_2]|nr:hypothetical protein FQN49_002538 [Arthroderma sp. PD_2]
MGRNSWTSISLLLAFIYVGGAFSDFERDCSVRSTAPCIKPDARGSVSFEFKPLFPKDVNFVYAFDSQNQSEIDNQYLPPGSTPKPYSKVSFWVEYPESNLVPSAHTETYMAVLMNENITGVPSGGNNGCDGVWGDKCSANIEAWVKAEVTSGSGISLTDALFKLFASKKSYSSEGNRLLANLSCPQGVLRKYYHPKGPGILARENGARFTKIEPSGTTSNPHVTEVLEDASYEQQIERVAAMLLVRKPLEGDLYKNADNIQFEMACVKAERSHEENNSGGEEGDGGGRDVIGSEMGSGAVRPGSWSTALVPVAALAWGIMLI